ncbi:unnamed protein product [Parnassius apollo]|uniref:(apollo) hypothetical protein n=1 Tax=Parnassius apollo TaxID=110799 RepID=A0A8S3Y5J3_PARAO|nr:unnamed protein product [Parnassius apollo]
MERLLMQNNIDLFKFARDTKEHFFRKTGKKNNLFFFGPPSTGKTMLMRSLVDMHYNYAILTGLQPTSAFNFANLVTRNACFMDECRLTDNQFEQWKLLAGGQTMNTEVKYKNQLLIENCVLYTASNYEIGTYLQCGNTHDAIAERTIQYNFYHKTEFIKLNAFIWEKFWEKIWQRVTLRRDRAQY